MRGRLKTAKNISLLIFSIGTLFNCGVDRDPYFEPSDKRYGAARDPDSSAVAPVPDKNRDGQAPQPETTTDPDLKIDPNRLVFHSRFVGIPNRKSLVFLTPGGGYQPESSAIYTGIEGPFWEVDGFAKDIDALTEQTVHLVAKQTYGDGLSSRFTQAINSNLDADASSSGKFFRESRSDSGTQTYIRALRPNSCPRGFVCIDQVLNQPKVGNPETICFSKRGSVEPAPMPYGATPGAKPSDYASDFVDLGQYSAYFYNQDARY